MTNPGIFNLEKKTFDDKKLLRVYTFMGFTIVIFFATRVHFDFVFVFTLGFAKKKIHIYIASFLSE